jgi:osmoprotectant transport system permease protein
MNYLINNFPYVLRLFLQHLQMTLEVVGFSLLIAVPLGVAVARARWLEGPVLGVLGVIYTIPSLSFFVLLIPLFGLGFTPAVIALVAYAQLALVRNWVVGLTSLDPAVLETAQGMGMNGWQRFWQVELPLALPLLLAGVRLAALSAIGIGTIAAYINAGGLGTLLFQGVVTANYEMILVGSIAVSVLAIGVNYLLRFLEHRAEASIRGEPA